MYYSLLLVGGGEDDWLTAKGLDLLNKVTIKVHELENPPDTLGHEDGNQTVTNESTN